MPERVRHLTPDAARAHTAKRVVFQRSAVNNFARVWSKQPEQKIIVPETIIENVSPRDIILGRIMELNGGTFLKDKGTITMHRKLAEDQKREYGADSLRTLAPLNTPITGILNVLQQRGVVTISRMAELDLVSFNTHGLSKKNIKILKEFQNLAQLHVKDNPPRRKA